MSLILMSGLAAAIHSIFTDKITLEKSCKSQVTFARRLFKLFVALHNTNIHPKSTTLDTTSYTPTNNTNNTMTDFSVIHAYLCGHFESQPMPGASAPQYVFVNSGCSNYECAHTDISWFQQGTSPTPKDMSSLAKSSRKLTNVQNSASKHAEYAAGLADADPYRLQCIAEIGFPNLLDAGFSHDAQAHMDSSLHLSTIKSLLKYARQFAKSSKTKPFFDFCMGELGYFLHEAKLADISMLNAQVVSELMAMDRLGELADDRQWPSSERHHQPGFGEEELSMLRSAGEAGEEILKTNLGPGSLHIASLLLRTLAQDDSSSTAPPDLPSSPTVSVVPIAPPTSQSIIDFETWIDEQEEAFVAELKVAAAKKAKKTVRQGRVKKLTRVGTGIDRVSKHYLPSLVRCA